jgi:hypothetical protein
VPLGLILVAYALLHIGIRLLAPDAVEHDEAEQLLLAQSLALGYGQAPPLYTWLQHGVFRMLGVGVLGLAVLKHACLLGVYGGTYLAARRLRGDPDLATVTALSLWLVPAVAWEAPRDLTHSVLAAALAMLTVHALVALADAPKVWRYAALGGLVGFGFLAKYNFVLFAGGLLGAALSVPTFRAALLDRRSAVTVLAAAAAVSPHLAWLAGHHALLSATDKLRLGTRPLDGAGIGLVQVLTDLVAFLGPLVVVVTLFVPAVRRSAADPDPLRSATRRLLERYLVVLVATLVLSVPFVGVRVFKARWCLALLVVAPLAFFLRAPAAALGPDSVRRLTRALLAVGILTLGVRFADVWSGPSLGMPSRLHLPIRELAAGIRAAGFRGGTIIAADVPLGGNLRLHFPDSRVLTPEIEALVVPTPPGALQCLVAWRPRREPGVLASLLAFAGERLGRPLPGADSSFAIEAPLSPPAGRAYALRLLAVPPGPPPCENAVAPPARAAPTPRRGPPLDTLQKDEGPGS